MYREKEQQLKQYRALVEQLSPKPKVIQNSLRAFWVGGTICAIGQFILNVLKNFGYSKDEAGMLTSILLIFAGALLTGLDVYDSIGKYAGAGSIVPISGFANSIVSPAIEYKKEGYVFGVGTKMFTIAGPVIVYGVLSSIVVGIVYYFLQ